MPYRQYFSYVTTGLMYLKYTLFLNGYKFGRCNFASCPIEDLQIIENLRKTDKKGDIHIKYDVILLISLS